MTRATIQVPRPCAEDWARMTPTAQGRHCSACQLTVTDFTQRTDAEILALLRQAAGGRVCGRFRAEQLDRELVHAPAAAPRWRAWLLTAAALWGVPAAAQNLRPTHPGGPVPLGGNAPATQQSAPAGVMDRPAAGSDTVAGSKLGEPTVVHAPSLRHITGRVTDAKTKEALPGVTVLVKGTSTGCSTDADGRFVLDAQLPAEAVLVFSSLGYNQQEMRLAGLPQAQNLAEVVMAAEEWSPGEVVTVMTGGIRLYYSWYTPRGLWYRLRSLPRRLTGRW